MKPRPHFVLVTSGLGSACGGIGVVSQMIVSALTPACQVSLWRHHIGLARPLRTVLLAARASLAGVRALTFIFYEHLHLAVLHQVIPRLNGLPYGVFLHGMEAWTPVVGKRRQALLRANILLANSETTVRKARAANPWLPEIKIVWLGVPRRDHPARPGELPPHGITVGRTVSTERLKGHDRVLDAWPLIVSGVPDARLTIVGSGNDLQRLKKRAQKEQLGGVDFTGRIGDPARNQLYLRSRLLFCLSQQEGFGLAAVEAAASGIPILALAGTVIEELFPAGNGVVQVVDLRPESIAQAAIPVLTDSGLANLLGAAARKRVAACFTEDHFQSRFRAAISPFLD
ncbi:MAG: glycosyltransferase family 4 protein [Acidobacteria bacterium]|nr:glycosyltransferase family 4 protein [Acidobacteriota bacterium]